MTRIAKINLNIRKDKPFGNDPIILQQGEKDLTIEATIDNFEYAEIIQNATFQATKPDGTHILNDPANVSGNVISYPIPKQLTDTSGKITNANFYLNQDMNTVPFEIDITPGVQISDTGNPMDYVPGYAIVQKYMNSWSLKYMAMFKEMEDLVDGANVPAKFQEFMNKYLEEIKASYQPTIDNLENLADTEIAMLSEKENSINDYRKQVDKALENIKIKTSSITDFLQTVQNQIIAANKAFTQKQQDTLTESMHNSEIELQKNVAAMNGQISNEIKSLKAQGAEAIAQLKVDNATQLDDLKSKYDESVKNMDSDRAEAIGKVNASIDSANQKITDTLSDLDKKQSEKLAEIKNLNESDTGDLGELKTSLAETNKKFDSFNTKDEISSILKDYLTNSALITVLADYASKTDVAANATDISKLKTDLESQNTKIASLLDSDAVKALLAGYETIDSAKSISDSVTALQTSLKTTDSKFDNYNTKVELLATLNDYPTTATLNDLLKNYEPKDTTHATTVDISQLQDDLTALTKNLTDNYNSKTDITTVLKDYVSDSDLTTKLSTVASKASVATNSSDIAALKTNVAANTSNISSIKSDVSANTTSISSIKTDVATNKKNISSLTTSIASQNTLIDSKANKSDLTSLATKSDLEALAQQPSMTQAEFDAIATKENKFYVVNG